MTQKPSQKRSLAFIVLTVAGASSVSMLGGLAIESVADKLIPIIPLIIAMPTLNTMVGDYATIVASYEEAGSRGVQLKSLYRAVVTSVTINIIALIALSLVIATTRDYTLTGSFAVKYAAFIALSTVATVMSIVVIAKLLNRALRKHKLNADEVLIPIVTSVTDVLMLSLISLAVLTIF